MNIRETLLAALRSLRSNGLRSLLTTVGIIIGVAAVIILVALGNGMKAGFDAQFSKLANQITVTPRPGRCPVAAPRATSPTMTFERCRTRARHLTSPR